MITGSPTNGTSSDPCPDTRQINASGAGLLLGAALCVVLPEGFGTFWEAQVPLSLLSNCHMRCHVLICSVKGVLCMISLY